LSASLIQRSSRSERGRVNNLGASFTEVSVVNYRGSIIAVPFS
jgi:hypothetical protein